MNTKKGIRKKSYKREIFVVLVKKEQSKKKTKENGGKNPLELEKFAEDQKDLKNGYNKANKVSVFFFAFISTYFCTFILYIFLGGFFSVSYKENYLFIIFCLKCDQPLKAIILNLKAV